MFALIQIPIAHKATINSAELFGDFTYPVGVNYLFYCHSSLQDTYLQLVCVRLLGCQE